MTTPILNLTSFDPALKVHYTDARVKIQSYEGSPALAILPKYTKFGGKFLPITVQGATPRGRSATFATAQANKRASLYREFDITRVRDYATASIDNETFLASKGDKNAMMQAMVSEIDAAIQSASNSLASAIYRTGSGAIGRISSTSSVANTYFTLANPDDAVNFEVGDWLVVAATETGAVKTGGAGRFRVGAINRTTGRIDAVDAAGAPVVLSAAITAPVAVNDFLFVEGDAQSGGSPRKIAGFGAWLPETVTSTPFFGVDRTIDEVRYGGNRYDASGESLIEGLIGAAHRVRMQGGKPDIVFMNPVNVADICKALTSNVQYDSVRASDADISFEAIKVRTPSGTIKVVEDRFCPTDVGFMLQLDTWKLYSLGECPQILQQDGNMVLRDATTDSAEVRVGYYAQLGCSAPGWNCRIKLA